MIAALEESVSHALLPPRPVRMMRIGDGSHLEAHGPQWKRVDLMSKRQLLKTTCDEEGAREGGPYHTDVGRLG